MSLVVGNNPLDSSNSIRPAVCSNSKARDPFDTSSGIATKAPSASSSIWIQSMKKVAILIPH